MHINITYEYNTVKHYLKNLHKVRFYFFDNFHELEGIEIPMSLYSASI